MMQQGWSKTLSMYKFENLKSTLLPFLFPREEEEIIITCMKCQASGPKNFVCADCHTSHMWKPGKCKKVTGESPTSTDKIIDGVYTSLGIQNDEVVAGIVIADSDEIKESNSVKYASFGERTLAAIIDIIPGVILGGLFPAFGSSLVLGILYGWLYSALLEPSQYQGSLGKIAMGIIVTDDKFQRIDFVTATGRHFSRVLSALILFIGYLMMLWSDEKKCLHDKMVGTLVLKK